MRVIEGYTRASAWRAAKALTVMSVGLVLFGCSSIPPISQREPSPYSVTKENHQYVSFYVHVFPIRQEDLTTVEVWYQQRRVMDGRILAQTGDTVRVVFKGWFTPDATEPATVKLMTTGGEIHEFNVGDPVENTAEIFRGTRYSFK